MEWNNFNFIWTNIQNGNHHITYILDSNVVVGLSKYYYQRIKNKNENYRYEQLYKYLLCEDVVPGIAIRELSWDVEKNEVNKEKEKKLVEAMDGLFSYLNKGKNSYSSFNSMNFNTLEKNRNANQLLVMSFCLFKKLAILYSTERSKDIIFNKLVDFILKEHKMLLSYEMTLITYWLFSNKKELKDLLSKLLKINSKNIGEWQIYNASWDIFFIRVINNLTALSKDNATIDNIYNVCLISEDKALTELGNLTILNNEISNIERGGMTIPANGINTDDIKDEYKKLVVDRIQYLYKTFSDRKTFINNNKDIIGYYFELMKKLDEEIWGLNSKHM